MTNHAHVKEDGSANSRMHIHVYHMGVGKEVQAPLHQ
jgi:hypothetical protein